jgi:hypothetical protein
VSVLFRQALDHSKKLNLIPIGERRYFDVT